MFLLSIQRAGQTRRYSVAARAGGGWEATTAQNGRILRQVRYRDWHRVERIVERFRREVDDLTTQGWQVQSTNR